MLRHLQNFPALDSRAPDRDRDSVKTVLLVDAGGLDDELECALADLGYGVAKANSEAGDWKERATGCMAAIVCCQDAGSLLPVAELSPLCPVITVGDDQSFDFGLAGARAGARAMVNRPCDMVELAAWLEDFAEPPGQTPSILIVDDDELLAETYAMHLELAGMRTRVVTEPRRAISEIAEFSPDLVLMDLHMPDVGGIELAQVLRQSRRYLSLPIVFLSAESDVSQQNQARRLGGDDFIAKSTDLEQLASLVRMRAERAVGLRSVMERDSLTGLLNHARTIDRFQLEIDRCRRIGSQVSVALIDLDNFKTVNDTYGHQAGDLVIQNLARTLVAGLRRIDIVGRYGGEEFAIILLDTPPDAARAVVDKLRVQFSQMEFDAGGTPYHVTFSAGIAAGNGLKDAGTMIANADEALYAAKHAGRNRVTVHESEPVPLHDNASFAPA